MKTEPYSDSTANQVETKIQGEMLPAKNVPVSDEYLEVMRDRHMTGRAVRVDETLAQYQQERLKSWEQVKVEFESRRAIFADVDQSTECAASSVIHANQKKKDDQRISEVEASLGIRATELAPKQGTEKVGLVASVEGKVNKDLLDYITSSVSEVIKLGHVPLASEEKVLLQKVKVGFRTALADAGNTGISKMSVREFVFQQMPDLFDAYENLLFKAKSVSLHGELWNSIPEEGKQSFYVHQTKAADVFQRMQSGEEFVDFSLTDAEKGLIEKSRAITIAAKNVREMSNQDISRQDVLKQVAFELTGTTQGDFFDQHDKLVYQNFVQKVALDLARGMSLRDPAAFLSSDKIPSTTENTMPFQEGEKSWENVVRISDQEAIGDLNGSYESFVAHLEQRGLIRQGVTGIEWIGDNKRVVFVGDILGDRTPHGLKIMEALVRLDGEAKKHGGSVESLAGNHDNMFAAVLGGYDTEFGVAPEDDDRIFDYGGTLESSFYADPVFKKYVIDAFKRNYVNKAIDIQQVIDKKQKILSKQTDTGLIQIFTQGIADAQADLNELNDVYKNISPDDESRFMACLKSLSPGDARQIGKALVKNRQAILTNMKKTESGKRRLEAVCSQKLATCIDDTLYTHTNLTTEMVQDLIAGDSLQEGIKKVNALYQKGVRYHLLGEGQMSKQELADFDALRTRFISTSSASRINYSEDQKTTPEEKQKLQNALKKGGINLAIHGHNDEKGVVQGTSDLPIVSIDRSVYKGYESYGTNSPKATLTIDMKGNVRSQEAAQVVRARSLKS